MSAGVVDSAPRSAFQRILDRSFESDADASPLVRRAWAIAPFALIFVVALVSRLRYAVWAYHATFGSGDADLMLTRAMFISRGEFRPPLQLGPAANVFIDPPGIALIFATVSKLGVPLHTAPFIVTPILTIAAMFALFALLRRAFDTQIALISVCLVSLIPRFSFDSTEPDKVGFVLSFFIIALFFMYEAQLRPKLYLLAGLFMGFSVFSHNTGYLFLPVFLISHVALSRARPARLFNRYALAAMIMPLLFIAISVALNASFSRDQYSYAADAAATAGTPPVAAAPAPAGGITLPPVLVQSPGRNRFVPAAVETYWNHTRDLAENGFRDGAWSVYFDAIRRQAGRPVYWLAIGGWTLALALVVVKRRFEIVPLMAWMLLVTLAFAIQYTAASHRSRYPSYVTPVFVIFACFIVIAAARADRAAR